MNVDTRITPENRFSIQPAERRDHEAGWRIIDRQTGQFLEPWFASYREAQQHIQAILGAKAA